MSHVSVAVGSKTVVRLNDDDVGSEALLRRDSKTGVVLKMPGLTNELADTQVVQSRLSKLTQST